MELRDIRATFFPADVAADQEHSIEPPLIRVALLTENSAVATDVRRALIGAQTLLTEVCSTNLVARAIGRNICDVAIIDVERKNAWPALVFSQFDELAAQFPIIMLCKEQHQVLSYLRKAQHVVDVYAYQTISDPRFSSVVQAATLRRDAIRYDHQNDDWDAPLPPAA